MDGEHKAAAPRVIVEHRFHRRVGQDASIPVKLAVDPDRGKCRRQRPGSHHVPDRQRCRTAVEIMHLAALDIGGADRQPRFSGVQAVAVNLRTSVAGTQIDRNIHGFGDIQIGLTHQLLRERGWVPDVLASVNWSANTGKGDPLISNGPAIGNGYHSLQAGLTFVKSQDPLVFFGGVNYLANLPTDTPIGRVDTGDGVSLRLGTALAASPYTSLRFAVSSIFAGNTSIDGQDAAGSDTRAASFEIGGGTVLGDSTLLDVSATIGITDDAPDFQFAVSLPTRF